MVIDAHVACAGEDEAPDSMVDPALSLNRAVPDPLVSRDHDEVEAADDLEPGLVDEPAPPAHAAYECAVSSNAHAARTSSTGMS